MTDSREHNHHQAHKGVEDAGFTLTELLIVLVILGVLGTVVVMALGGMSTNAADVGCKADRHVVHTAAESFFAQTGADTIAATGTDHDRYEQTLVDGEFLGSTSAMHDVDPDGVVTAQVGSSC